MAMMVLSLILVMVVAIGVLSPAISDRWLHPLERGASRFAQKPSRMILSLGIATILCRLAVLPISPLPVPAVHDEYSYLLGADTFAHGRLTNPTHPMWVFLDTFHVLQQPTYQSIYPPAQAGALALGQRLGHPWIGVLGSIAAFVMAVTWMLAGWFPPRWALLGGVLVVARFCLFNYWVNSYWGGAVAALGGALVLGSFPRILRKRRTADALWMALGISLLANSRPLEALIFSVPLVVAFAGWLVAGRQQWSIVIRRVLLPLFCGLLLTAAFMAYYNLRVTHDVWLFPRALYQKVRLNYPAFVWQKPGLPFHYANPQFEQFYNVFTREAYAPPWYELGGEKLVSWCYFFMGLALYPAMLAVPQLLRDRRMRLPGIQFFCCLAGLVAVNYYFPHYAAPMTGTYYILLIQALRHLRRWRYKYHPVGIPLTRLMVSFAFLGTVLTGVQVYRFPRQPWSIERMRILHRLEAVPGNHLVLVRYTPTHNIHQEWVYNAADIDRSRVVWAREIPGLDARPLLDYFKGRSVWVVQPDLSPPSLDPYISTSSQVPDPNR